MKTLQMHGNFEVVEYGENLVTIDFTNENVGLTIKAFSNKEKALQAFSTFVKPLTKKQAGRLKEETRKGIVYS